MTGKAIFQPVHYVANHRAGRRRNDPYSVRQVRDRALARAVEQSLCRQARLELFKEQHQRAFAGKLQPVRDYLIT